MPVCSLCENAASDGHHELVNEVLDLRQGRDRKDFAVEFGEYLATAVDDFLVALNHRDSARMLSDFGAEQAASGTRKYAAAEHTRGGRTLPACSAKIETPTRAGSGA